MRDDERYVVLSLELHLFFARIMKEHALFLEAGFTPANADFAGEAERLKQEFEALLERVVTLSDGVVGGRILCSGEVITQFTEFAECKTEEFTGIAINGGITKREACLRAQENPRISMELYREVQLLNQRAIKLLNELIAFKERILNDVCCCKMFTGNYPLLIEHILREAKLYHTYVCDLEKGMDLNNQSMKQTERFWNQIMMEHALFIRGLLDPTENELIQTADVFAGNYARLLKNCLETHDRTIVFDKGASLKETIKFRDFKAAGTKGIEECRIRSVILPLLADHVLREANHYIRLLEN